MDDKRRAEVLDIVNHFEGKAITSKVLIEYSNLKKITPVSLGEYQDFQAQVNHDNIVVEMFPLIVKELQKLQYKPEFAKKGERERIEAENDEVRVNITKLLEKNGIKYQLVTTLCEELGNFVGGKIASAGQTAFNKASEVMFHIAKEKFGGAFNMKHSADYAKDVIEKKFDKTKNKNKI